MKTLADIAKSQYRMLADVNENTVEICRRDPERNFSFIGPLATVNMGVTEEDDYGDDVFCLNSEDGCVLYAIATLPKMADLVLWASAELNKLNGIHFDSTTEAGRFHQELRDRLTWIISAVDDRQQTMSHGTWSVE